MFWAYMQEATDTWKWFRHKYILSTGAIFEDWLDRLAVMGVIEEEDWHREHGNFYNIPKCCIEWYISIKVYKGEEDPLVVTDILFGKDERVDDFGYVRCPNCRLKEKYYG